MRTQIEESQAGTAAQEPSGSAAIPAAPDVEPGSTSGDSAQFSAAATSPTSALSACIHFLRNSWMGALGVSAAVLVPCFWHRRIEAGDLASHTYNAWIAQLIERGQAPGLQLANQWNNVLFDLGLSRLGYIVGLPIDEKICVSAAILIFFWGAFALAGAFARRAPWALAPMFAMFTYGWTFQQGFLNYYISMGLAFFGVALLQRGRGLERLAAVAILPLAWMAHPLGAALLLALGLYVLVAANSPLRRQMMLLAGACAALLAATVYISTRFRVSWSGEGSLQSLLTYNGADQLLLYGARYRLPSILLSGFALACVAQDLLRRRAQKESWSIFSLPLQIYGLTLLAGILLPSAITLPGYAVPLSLLTERLTSVTAVLACCILGMAKPQKWQFPCLAAIAAVFFFFLYSDTGKLNKMEETAERFERVLPPGQRIIATIWPFPGSRLLINHIVDRACIGQCFSYGNYEPSSGQFRVRAAQENPYVLTDPASVDEVESGNYIVRAQDAPVFEIYQCSLNMTDLCMRELVAGDRNGEVGVHPAERSPNR